MSIAENKKAGIKWRAWDVLLAGIATTVFILIAIYYLRYTITAPENGVLGSLFIGLTLIYQWLAMLLPVYLIAIKGKGAHWRDFGFRQRISFWKALRYAIYGYLTWIAGMFVITHLLLILYSVFGIQIPGFILPESNLPMFGLDGFNLSLAFVLIAILTPIVEEIYFRGFMLQAMLVKFGRIWGSLITAFLFALVHFQFEGLLLYLTIGLIINELFIRTKSLWVTILFHFINNGIAFIILTLT